MDPGYWVRNLSCIGCKFGHQVAPLCHNTKDCPFGSRDFHHPDRVYELWLSATRWQADLQIGAEWYVTSFPISEKGEGALQDGLGHAGAAGQQVERKRKKEKMLKFWKNFCQDEIKVPHLLQDEKAARPSAHKSRESSWEAGDVSIIFSQDGNSSNLAIIEIWESGNYKRWKESRWQS